MRIIPGRARKLTDSGVYRGRALRHWNKGCIYAAMAFSALVESLNMLARRAEKKRDVAES